MLLKNKIFSNKNFLFNNIMEEYEKKYIKLLNKKKDLKENLYQLIEVNILLKQHLNMSNINLVKKLQELELTKRRVSENKIFLINTVKKEPPKPQVFKSVFNYIGGNKKEELSEKEKILIRQKEELHKLKIEIDKLRI
jgi:hypothetical protein